MSASVTANNNFSIDVPGGRLAAERWPGSGPTLVLLHASVADRRAWTATANALAGTYAVVAYDRRGFGESPPSPEPFNHVEDLRAVLDTVAVERAWLVGSSAGGRVALDAALSYPDRVSGLVLLAPAISGAPDFEADAETEALFAQIDAAGDLAEVNRLEARLWLDGPAGPEGRVGGPARELFLAMNAIALRAEAESPAGAGNSEIDVWSRLAEITVPVIVAWGELDIEVLNDRCRELVERLPAASGRELPHLAHLPDLEDPGLVADLIRTAVAS